MIQYYNAKGLAWMKCVENKLEGGISKFFPESVLEKMIIDLVDHKVELVGQPGVLKFK